MRSAKRAGGNAPAIAKARIAVIKKAGNAKALLDAVPAERRRDVGYIFSRAQWLRRADKLAEAAALDAHAAARSAAALDTDQWWIERRLIARKLLDDGDAKTAYRVARDARVPSRENYRVEHQFTAGWIALRFLNDPATALAHFARIAQGISNPISLARASYWQGRAAEAMGRSDEARAHYQAAAHYPTAYYGQIARAKLGIKDLVLRPPPERARHARQLEVVRAVESLYAVGERDLVAGMLADLGERAPGCGRARRARRRRHPQQRRPRHAAARQGARSRADCRSSITPSRPSAFPTTSRSGRRSIRRSSTPSPARKARSTSAPSRPPRRWA